MPIDKHASVSLDLLRATAALMVFLHHCNWFDLDGGALAWVRRDIGHSAVVIFFVLSGYVIAATLRPGRGALDYGIKRASRIYSVAIPAVLLAFAIDLLTARLSLPPSGAAYELGKPWLYGAIALTFTGDLWGLAEPAFSNTPYWSLNYEVWYYVAFGVAVFTRGAVRWAALLLVLAVMGPKLWLLFPIWLGGVAVHALARSRPIPRQPARALAMAAVALFVAVKVLSLEDPLNHAVETLLSAHLPFALRFSQWFLGDYLVGLLAMALVYALATAEFRLPRPLQLPAVGLAKLSFTLYLMHYPLLRFFGLLFPGRGWLAIALAFCGALALGAVFEPQKDRLRRLLTLSLRPKTT